MFTVICFIIYISQIIPASSYGIPKISKNLFEKPYKFNIEYLICFVFFHKAIYYTSVILLAMFSTLGNIYVISLGGRDIKLQSDMPQWVFLLLNLANKFQD